MAHPPPMRRLPPKLWWGAGDALEASGQGMNQFRLGTQCLASATWFYFFISGVFIIISPLRDYLYRHGLFNQDERIILKINTP